VSIINELCAEFSSCIYYMNLTVILLANTMFSDFLILFAERCGC